MKHIHLFRKANGGCACISGKVDCDSLYECECGASFTTREDYSVHFAMPQYIAGADLPPEIEYTLPDDEIGKDEAEDR